MQTVQIKIIILLFICVNCKALDTTKVNRNLRIIRYSSLFIAGYAEGTKDALSFHPDKFNKVHSGWNMYFWLPTNSWKRKYKDYDNGDLRPRFFGSKSFFVFATDGWHLTNMINHIGWLGASITIPLNGKKKFIWYLKEAAISYTINRAGFYTSYNLIYK